MEEHIYKHIELTGTSAKSIEAAAENAVKRAAKTVREMRWLEVTGTRAKVSGGKVVLWQVTVKIGFRIVD